MGDIQDLIHESTMRAVAIGVVHERERIIEILRNKQLEVSGGIFDAKGVLSNLITELKKDTVVSEEA